MEIQSTAFNVFFPKVNNLRQKFFMFEEKLAGQFVTPLTLVPIPDQAPEEIPRISAVSLNGHSILNVALNHLSLQTTYDDRFNNNWGQCMTYVQDRVFPLLDMMEGLVGNEFLYSGLTTQVFYKFDHEVIDHFMEKYVKFSSQSSPFDVNLKFTYVHEEDFYINISLNNVRVYEGTGNPDIVTPAYLEQTAQGMAVVIDINDRHGFNYKQEYRSSREKVNRILSLSDEIMNHKIKEIVFEGGVKL